MWSEFRLVGLNRLRRRTYDPVIIKRTIGIVLGPFTALYRSFLMHCTLTNKTVGTIWRDLSKPPQRRQGPDPRPLWLLVGNPLFLGPELASRRAEHRFTLADVFIYFWFTVLSPYMFVEWFLWHVRFRWLLVLGLYKEDYLQIFKCVSFSLHSFCG